MRLIILLILISCEKPPPTFKLNLSGYEVLQPLVITDNDTIQLTGRYDLEYKGQFDKKLEIVFQSPVETFMRVKINKTTSYKRTSKSHRFIAYD